ncbi:MAG: hypothetical protein ACREMM_09920 [Gemmatimonadales bacterium]
MEPRMTEIHARYPPLDARVREILENIHRDCKQLATESRNRGNEHQVEEFITWLSATFADRAVQVRREGPRAPVSAEDARRWAAARQRSDAPCAGRGRAATHPRRGLRRLGGGRRC